MLLVGWHEGQLASKKYCHNSLAIANFEDQLNPEELWKEAPLKKLNVYIWVCVVQ